MSKLVVDPQNCQDRVMKNILKKTIIPMKTQPHFAAVAVSTTSIIALQVLSVLNPLPTHAQNSANIVLSNQSILLSQSTGSRIRFVPPVNKNPRQSQGSGSRGCRNQSVQANLVTLLIPSKEYVGQTLSGRPTFFWHLSQPVSVPMQFSLVEDKSGGKTVLKQQIDSPQPGIIQVEIPQNQPELVTGRLYRWNITLLCNANRPSENVFLQSWIERVSATPTLKQQLAGARLNRNSTPQQLRDRASIYARSGLWYDAITTLSDALKANPQNTLVQDDFFSLLDQVGLSEVAKQERKRFAQK